MGYLKLFKSNRNIMLRLLGDGILYGYIKNSPEYRNVPDDDTVALRESQAKMKRNH